MTNDPFEKHLSASWSERPLSLEHTGHLRRIAGLLILSAVVCSAFAGCSDNKVVGGGGGYGYSGDTSVAGAAHFRRALRNRRQ